MGRRALIAAAIIATASFGHAPIKTRSLRLQLEKGELQGLVELHVPAAAARAYAAAQNEGLALVPAALDGLRMEADGRPLPVKAEGTSVRKQRDGSIDASFLLAPQKAPQKSLRIFVEQGLPLPIVLIAETGVKLVLRDGPGAPIRGGLSLRPRPGLPVSVEVTGKPR